MTDPLILSSAALSSSLSQDNPAATSKTTYLRKCIEDLSPEKVAGFEKKANQWNLISKISIAAFFALAIGTFIAISIFAPAYIPVAGLAAIILAILASNKILDFQHAAQNAQNEAEKYRTIQSHYADLTGRTPLELQRILLHMGIIWNRIPGMQIQHPENLSRLNPLLAQAQYFEKQTEDLMNARNQFASDARGTSLTRSQKHLMQTIALQNEDNAVMSKIKNAFINAVLRNPDFAGTMDDLGTFSKSSWSQRLQDAALGDPTADQIFTFSDNRFSPLTGNDVKTMSVAELAQRIFSAMPMYTLRD